MRNLDLIFAPFKFIGLTYVMTLASLCTTFSQKNDFIFTHLSISDGLSQSSVISIAQDKNGLIWFGTRDGLNKYDGQNFTVYGHDTNDSSSISNNDITSIIVDARGDLWIGTFNGLNKYDHRKDRFTQFFKDTQDSTTISDNSIWKIVEARNGDIWIGTAHGLNRYDRTTGRFERFYHDPQDKFSLSDNYVQDVFEDSEGFLWVATAEGLNRTTANNIYKNDKLDFLRFKHKPGDSSSLSNNYIQVVREDDHGDLWIGTKYGGLNKYDKKTNSFETFAFKSNDLNSISNDDVRCLAFDKKGKLWIGTYSGLTLMDTDNKQFYRFLNDKDDPNTLSKNSVKSIFIDAKGSLWVGTYYGGINLMDPQNSNFKNYKYKSNSSGLSFEVISAFIQDEEGTIYIGTEGGGVNILETNEKKFRYIKKSDSRGSITSNNIKSLYLDKRKHLWIGTYNGGLNILNLNDHEIKHYTSDSGDPKSALSDNDIYSILNQNDSLFWIGTHGGGLNLFNINSKHVSYIREGMPDGLTSDLIRVLFKDSKDNLWIATQYGLNFLSNENIKSNNINFKHYFFNRKKLSDEDILTIFEDSKSRLWVGTNESGLNLFDPETDKFKCFNLDEMLEYTSNVVHGILEDNDGNLWISTNQGILQLNPQDSTYKKFDESDGLVANEFNNNACMKTRDGEMYFGSLKGITKFDPDSIIINHYTPPVVITDLKLFGKTVKVGGNDGVLSKTVTYTEQITLDYDQAIFTVGFAIPNFINSNKNYYAYRLKGLEDQWNVTSNGYATYTIQKPGTYVFQVKGYNNDGLTNVEPTTLQVIVKPAPWRTWWAFLLYAVITSTVLIVLVNIILSRSKYKHELDLEHLNNEKQKSLNKMKLQFFTNISHEFRTPLTLILAPLEQIIAEYRGSNKLYKKLLVVEKNANRLLRLIDQLMDFRKFENNHFKLKAAEGNIVKFLNEIYLSFKEYAKMHGVNYKFISDEDSIMLWYDRDKMERVIFNLISNAFKYSYDNGRVSVSVKKVDGIVEIAVVDNGVGMEKEHLEKIFERFYEVDSGKNLLHTKYNKGTGIGLALAKGIVDLHSGNILVKSEKNEGSTFIVQLPTGNFHLKEDEIIKGFKNSEDISNYGLKDYFPDVYETPEPLLTGNKDAATILIVEDNDQVRHYIVQIFKDLYNIKEASNGKQGLNWAIQSPPDLIISDVMMPEMDGIEFCSQIKSNIKTSHVPFILLTARTSLIFKFEGLETGADDYINKPFNVKELEIKVKNLINSQRKLKDKFTKDSVIEPGEITVTSMDEKLLHKALQIVEKNISNEIFDIPTFCEELGVSRSMLFTKIKAWTNLPPNEFIQMMRLKRAAQLLEQNKLNISQVGSAVGFKSAKYFSKCFQRHFSLTPTQYAKKFTLPKEINK